jgi:hypothetical protein
LGDHAMKNGAVIEGDAVFFLMRNRAGPIFGAVSRDR